jgi:hypothetical protein
VTVDWNLELADQLESHWADQLRPRLDGLTDDEYFWEPVPGCWTVTRDGEIDQSGPPVTTIAWRLAHLVYVFGPPSAPHFDRHRADRPSVDYSGDAAGALQQLDAGHDAWIRDVRALGSEGLARPQGDLSPPEFADAPVAKLVLHVHREVIHHGAEICLLRDLYLRKNN